MTLSITSIITHILAHSALPHILNCEDATRTLNPDHRPLLSLLVREAFCRLAFRLAHHLQDADFGSDDSDTLSLRFADSRIADKIQDEIIWTLAARTIEIILARSSDPNYSYFAALADEGTDMILRRLDQPAVSVRPWRL